MPAGHNDLAGCDVRIGHGPCRSAERRLTAEGETYDGDGEPCAQPRRVSYRLAPDFNLVAYVMPTIFPPYELPWIGCGPQLKISTSTSRPDSTTMLPSASAASDWAEHHSKSSSTTS